MQTQWEESGEANTPVQLHKKFQELQKAIKQWASMKVGLIKGQIKACRDFLGWIDKVKEIRTASALEKFIACIVKKRHTDLSVLEEDIWKQRAKIKWKIYGDKNTSYFHTLASSSKRTNTITQIEWNGAVYSDQQAKAQAFFMFYKDLVGSTSTSMPDICWNNLYSDRTYSLTELGEPITITEIQKVIQ